MGGGVLEHKFKYQVWDFKYSVAILKIFGSVCVEYTVSAATGLQTLKVVVGGRWGQRELVARGEGAGSFFLPVGNVTRLDKTIQN